MMDNQKNVFDFIKNNITILDYIPYGKDNAIKRSTLADLTKLPDRAVRRLLKNLIADYGVIANYETGGYYRTTEIAEIENVIKIEHARLISIVHTINQLQQYEDILKNEKR